MSLLAEVVVEEWLNRQGYFTIRGIKVGVDEIDILAVKPLPGGTMECRHIEVQVSVRPVSYICHVPKQVQKDTGRAANSAKRSASELADGVREWVEKKFRKPNKLRLLATLGSGEWTRELVVHKVKHEEELNLICGYGIRVIRLSKIVAALRSPKTAIAAAAGADLLELMHVASGRDSVLADAIEATSEGAR